MTMLPGNDLKVREACQFRQGLRVIDHITLAKKVR
jgi:hypothetical protein